MTRALFVPIVNVLVIIAIVCAIFALDVRCVHVEDHMVCIANW